MDLLQEMKLASLLPKAIHLKSDIVPAETIVEMATLHGARAIGHEDKLGSLEIGKKADFISINLSNKLYGVPQRDPVSAVVYIATGADVENVVINGKLVIENKNMLTMNEAEVIKLGHVHGEQVRERTGLPLEAAGRRSK